MDKPDYFDMRDALQRVGWNSESVPARNPAAVAWRARALARMVKKLYAMCAAKTKPVVLGLVCLILTQFAIAAESHRSVLLVHSYHSGMAWTDAQHQGFATTLRQSGMPIDLHTEYLDSLRHRQRPALMRENLRRTLLGKFADNPPQVIAVTDNNAFDFINYIRDQLAPGVPLVFSGINGLDTDLRSYHPNLTGVAEEASFEETLDVMEQLLPGRRVLVLGEETPTFRENFESLHRANQRRQTPARLEVFENPVLEKIQERLSRLESDTVVLLLNRPINTRGETIDSATAVRAISDASSQPVFSAWDYMLGDGIVGGMLTSGEAQGRTAARKVLRILNGEAADSIPIQWDSPNRYFFDYEQLRRFDLQDRPLPEGSVVINRPPNFYQEHPQVVISGVVGLILVLLLAIRLLMVGKSLRLNRDLLGSIVDNIPVMVFVKRASDLSFVLFNRAGETLLGRDRKEILGHRDYDFFPREQADFFVGKDREVLQQQGVVDIAEEPIETPNGTRVLHTQKLALRDSFGKPTHLLGISEDITDRLQAEDALRQYRDELEETVQQRTSELRLARDAAEAANRAKSAFLANMSHELRTPLNAILGFSQLMQQSSGLDKSQRETLDIINSSGTHLLRLINDVLEITKIEAGKLELENSTFDLHALVRDVSDMMRLRAQQKGLWLELDQSSDFPRFIMGDSARLRQILVNLVSNAVRYTERGGVTIRVRVKDNAEHHLLIEIEDSGPGISDEDQNKLFQPFVQLAEGPEQGGTGLGLSIVHQFVNLMHGSISIDSQPGQGSIFRIEIPLQEPEDAEVSRLSDIRRGEISGLAPGQPVYRILIAEDQHDNWLLLSRLMNSLGLEVRVAVNGAECLRLFEEWQPDLIWMDRRMPVMDGVEATRGIRQLPGGDKVKIVAVTASAFREQQAELRDAGMDDFVSKPYRFSEIYRCLERQLGLRFVYRETEAPEEVTTLSCEQLALLPVAVRNNLRHALESLEPQAINNAIMQVAEYDTEMVDVLEKIVQGFDYQMILNALKEVES